MCLIHLDSEVLADPRNYASQQDLAPGHSRYSLTAILLHWSLGLAIVALFGAGLYMVSLPFSPLRLKLYNWHKWAGTTLLALLALRLLWRDTHRPPALPVHIADAMPTWEHQVHHATHTALYILFFAVPLLGWAYSSAAGFPIVLFGVLPLPDFVPADKAMAAFLKPWHQASAFALIGLALLHAAAALKHQFIDHDGLISRMWPGRG